MAGCLSWLWASNPPDNSPAGVLRREKKNLRREQRQLEREAHNLEREVQRHITNAKREVKRGNEDGARTMAREIAHSRVHILKLRRGSAQLGIVGSELSAQAAIARTGAAIAVSAQLMSALNQLYSLERTKALVTEFARQLDLSKTVQESMQDALDSLEPVVEPEAPEEQLMQEVLQEVLPEAPKKRVLARQTLGADLMKRPLIAPMMEQEMESI